MRAEYVARWENVEFALAGDELRTPQDLLGRRAASDDFIDSAVIAGFEVKEIVAGHVAEAQIPQDVIHAFHAQFPNVHESFVEMVSRLGHDPVGLGC